MKKLVSIALLSLSINFAGAAITNTNVMATRTWVSNYVASIGFGGTNSPVTNSISLTNFVRNVVGTNTQVVASCNWFISTNYNQTGGATISSNASGLYRLTVANNLGVDFLNRTNGVPHITATVSTNAGCTVGLFMVTSNIVDFYTRTNGILVNPESIQAIVAK